MLSAMKWGRFSFAFAAFAVASLAFAQTPVPNKPSDHTRLMTYNIQWFHKGVSDGRITNLKSTLKSVNPDIVGVQEVEGRTALKRVFDNDWQIGIADLPDEFQEVGIAVKRPYQLVSYELEFTGKPLDYAFPGHRDVLRAVIKMPSEKELIVYVHHMKSRSGGRMQTDPQRQMAAGMLASYIKWRGDQNVIVMGDMNDAPNDRTANILESGDVNAKAGDEKDFRLLANITQELAEKDYITFDLHSLYFGEPGVKAIVSGAKADNDRLRDRDYRFPQDVKVPQAFFDQIFCSPNIYARGANAFVYDGEDALRGLGGRVKVSEDPNTGARTVEYLEEGTRASDHLPVYADIWLK